MLFLFLALLLLQVPLRWLIAGAVAAGVHELCHLLALYSLGIRGIRLRPGIAGARLEIPPLSASQELVCALAGPLGALLLLLTYRWFPRLAICAGVQSVFNLLPIAPLDGGRSLGAALALLLPPKAARITQRVVELLVCPVLLGLSFALDLGLLPVFGAVFVIIRALSRKFPCNVADLAVQ